MAVIMGNWPTSPSRVLLTRSSGGCQITHRLPTHHPHISRRRSLPAGWSCQERHQPGLPDRGRLTPEVGNCSTFGCRWLNGSKSALFCTRARRLGPMSAPSPLHLASISRPSPVALGAIGDPLQLLGSSALTGVATPASGRPQGRDSGRAAGFSSTIFVPWSSVRARALPGPAGTGPSFPAGIEGHR